MSRNTGLSLGLAVAMFIVGITTGGTWWLGVLGVMLAIFTFAAMGNNRKRAALRQAGPGATRVETVKSIYVNQTVQQYAAAGWEVLQQSTAKSLGSQARVTLTFRKS